MTGPDKQTTLEDSQVNAAEKADQAQEAEVVTPPTPPAAEEKPTPEAPKSILSDEDRREMTLAARNTETSILSPVQYNQSKIVAKDFFESGALPKHIQNETQAFVTIITGAEMGLKPMEAIQGLYIINGIITLWGKAVPRQLKKHGWKHKFTEEDQDHCTVLVWKGDSFKEPADTDEQYEETFYYKDAEASKYTQDSYGKQKVGWLPGQNRKLKMRYNVLSALIKTYIPDVLGQAADIAEVAQDFIEGEVVNDKTAVNPKDAIRQALKNKKAEGTVAPKHNAAAVDQEQGEKEDEAV